MQWETIESAPKDGTPVVCWAMGWDFPMFLVWKKNPRIVAAHMRGESQELASEYFGDRAESDDYELAEEGGGPTHWHPLAIPPKIKEETT